MPLPKIIYDYKFTLLPDSHIRTRIESHLNRNQTHQKGVFRLSIKQSWTFTYNLYIRAISQLYAQRMPNRLHDLYSDKLVHPPPHIHNVRLHALKALLVNVPTTIV